MSWIELHDDLREHPKAARLVEAMGWSDADLAVGKLARLWLWALHYAPSGSLDRFTKAQLARAAGIDPTLADQWVQSLVDAGWLDTAPRLRIHDWWQYAGYYLKKKWEQKPHLWKAVLADYGTGADPPGQSGGDATAPPRTRSGNVAEPPRVRSGDAAEPSTLTKPTNQPTGEGEAPAPPEGVDQSLEELPTWLRIQQEKKLERAEKRIQALREKERTEAEKAELRTLKAEAQKLKAALGFAA